MKPSDIVIHALVPLVNVFGKAEAEQAAALIVLTLTTTDDTWRAVLPKEVGECLKANTLEWTRSPFLRPNFDHLIDGGWAEWVEDGKEGRSRPIRFTDKGLDTLKASGWNKAAIDTWVAVNAKP